jgi:hypothetical protein
MVEEVKLTDTIKSALLPALGEAADLIYNEIETGVCQLWHFIGCGYVVTRCELDDENETLVVVAGAGKNLGAVFDYLCGYADQHAMKMRVHSKRFGMQRMLKPFGFEIQETIYTRDKYGRFV